MSSTRANFQASRFSTEQALLTIEELDEKTRSRKVPLTPKNSSESVDEAGERSGGAADFAFLSRE